MNSPVPKSLATAGWLVLLISPFLIYLSITYRYSSNLPYADDYVTILEPLLSNSGSGVSPSWPESAWKQHNEHRIVFTKLAALLQFKVSGAVDFRALILFAAVGWVATVALLAWSFTRYAGASRWEIIPIVFLMLTPTFEESMLWATSSLTFCWGAFFCVACLVSVTAARPVFAAS